MRSPEMTDHNILDERLGWLKVSIVFIRRLSGSWPDLIAPDLLFLFEVLSLALLRLLQLGLIGLRNGRLARAQQRKDQNQTNLRQDAGTTPNSSTGADHRRHRNRPPFPRRILTHDRNRHLLPVLLSRVQVHKHPLGLTSNN